MERRYFLASCLATTSAFALRSVRAQDVGLRRAAVVIGVDKPGDLPKLRAAASGARSIATWLAGEGFDVKLFTDDTKPVNASELFAAINTFVDRGTLDQLVIYFAGHGFISGALSEFWLLSHGPHDPNAAVSLNESCANAELCGIPNVVFISDACRSRADSLSAERVHGSVVFPSVTARLTSDVDLFLATRVGAASYEVSVAESAPAFEGIYTSCFLDAFKHPYASMVQTVDGKQVVPNRRLKPYLTEEVPKRAQAKLITLEQRPDSKILSDEPTFIGHVLSPERMPVGESVPTVADVARLAVWGSRTLGAAPQYSDRAIQQIGVTSGFDAARNAIVEARDLPNLLSAHTGFTISGQRVIAAVARPGIKTSIVNSPADGAALAQVAVELPRNDAASVALRLDDGSGTVLAALDGYVGNVVVSKGSIDNVSYVPSRSNPLRSAYEAEARRIDQLHAAAATAAQFGVLRIEGSKEIRRKEAARLADRFRVPKRIDPTLGIYAAYAYADAGLVDSVKSIQGAMRGDLKTDLFDVAMLAGTLSGRLLDDHDGPIPFCPMLSQGWSLLRVKDIRIPEVITAARNHLRVSLWMTLEREGMRIVESALRSGRVR